MFFSNVWKSAALSALLMSDGVVSTPMNLQNILRKDKRTTYADDIVSDASGQRKMRFLSSSTQEYQVTSLPDVPYDIGEMYAGSIPIQAGSTSNELFFIFQPTINDPVDEITIWLNGGPGCSSLNGFLEENGRFVWYPGASGVVINDYSWVNLTNMLWVEQPTSVGYSQGAAGYTNEEQLAQDFVGFLKNFQTTFGIQNFKIYVTGESYAGRYVPYISAAILNEKNTTYFDLHGALVYDPCIGQFNAVQEEYVVVPFVQQNQAFFPFDASTMSQLESSHEQCGYKKFIDTYLQFPPPGVQPYIPAEPASGCDLFNTVTNDIQNINSCFNIYEVNQTCPTPFDVLQPNNGSQAYFDRSDVKAALHAPASVTWVECSYANPFSGYGGPEDEGDLSPDPIQGVLPQVVEATNRVLVANGDYDMIIITNGTLLSIQNMTWNGALGFQQAPSEPIEISGQGQMGIQHYERGLMWGETYMSGHMEPQYQKQVSFRHLQWLLGYTDSL